MRYSSVFTFLKNKSKILYDLCIIMEKFIVLKKYKLAMVCAKVILNLFSRQIKRQLLFTIDVFCDPNLKITQHDMKNLHKMLFTYIYDDYYETLEGKYLPVDHCKIYSRGCEMEGDLYDLAMKEKWLLFEKETFGSFGLARWLREYRFKDNLDCVIVSGFCTDICVISNVLMIKSVLENIPIIVVEDACAGSSKEMHEKALEIMKGCHVDVVNMQDLGLRM